MGLARIGTIILYCNRLYIDLFGLDQDGYGERHLSLCFELRINKNMRNWWEW